MSETRRIPIFKRIRLSLGGSMIALCLVGIFGSHSSIADWSAVVIGFAIAWFVLPKT